MQTIQDTTEQPDKFDNYSAEELADLYGELDAKVKHFKTEQDELKEALKKRLTAGKKIQGKKFTALLSKTKDSYRVDEAAVKTHFGGFTPPHLQKLVKGSERLTVDAVKVWDGIDIPAPEAVA